MAINDYITCCKCDVKLIYDGGKDNNRQWWEERWGKEPEILCPDCEKKLEPVAWMLGDKFYKVKQCRFFSKNPGEEIPGQIPLYAAPPQHKPEQKPVAHCTLEQLVLLQRVVPSTGTIAIYTAPPQREWVGLTEDQFLEASRLAEDGNYMVAFQRIQQWLKEKNV